MRQGHGVASQVWHKRRRVEEGLGQGGSGLWCRRNRVSHLGGGEGGGVRGAGGGGGEGVTQGRQDGSLTSGDQLPAFLVETPPHNLCHILLPSVAVLVTQAPAAAHLHHPSSKPSFMQAV